MTRKPQSHPLAQIYQSLPDTLVVAVGLGDPQQ